MRTSTVLEDDEESMDSADDGGEEFELDGELYENN